jgi:hypothetical protein
MNTTARPQPTVDRRRALLAQLSAAAPPKASKAPKASRPVAPPPCPAPRELEAFFAGRARGRRADAVADHVATCPHCAALAAPARPLLTPAPVAKSAPPRAAAFGPLHIAGLTACVTLFLLANTPLLDVLGANADAAATLQASAPAPTTTPDMAGARVVPSVVAPAPGVASSVLPAAPPPAAPTALPAPAETPAPPSRPAVKESAPEVAKAQPDAAKATPEVSKPTPEVAKATPTSAAPSQATAAEGDQPEAAHAADASASHTEKENAGTTEKKPDGGGTPERRIESQGPAKPHPTPTRI